MAGEKKRVKKDKFSALEGDFKDQVAGMATDAIVDLIAKVAMDAEALIAAKEEDEDLKDKKEIAKDAEAVYRDGAKQCRLKIQFAKRVLEDRGAR